MLLTGTVALPPSDSPLPSAGGETTPVPADTPSASEYRGRKAKVSVSVDLSIRDGRLHLQATDFYDGPEEHESAPELDGPDNAALRAQVLQRFSTTLPLLPLPWGITATGAHSEGSDVLLVADTGPQNYTDDGFGVHLAFFSRTPAVARMRILEGRRRQVEERREGLRELVTRATRASDRYTRQLHELSLESSEREVRWLNELIAAEHTLPDATPQPGRGGTQETPEPPESAALDTTPVTQNSPAVTHVPGSSDVRGPREKEGEPDHG